MLYNEDFLYKLYNSNIQTKYAKIITLNWQEEPIAEIQGLVTGGSCNVDGNSAIRTTISLNMLTKTADVKEYTIMLKTKVKIDIGLENNIDKKYPSIIWFPLGIFIVTGYNTSINTTNTTISLTGKDKGCLLNGEISGVIGASTDFGQVDDYDEDYTLIVDPKNNGKGYYIKENDSYVIDLNGNSEVEHYERTLNFLTSKLPIREIIRNVVHIYGNEPNNKIIINDLDIGGRELLEYRGTKPMYLIKLVDAKRNTYVDLTFDGNYEIGGEKIGGLEENQYFSLNSIEDSVNDNVKVFTNNGKEYHIIQIQYGDTIGYKGTDLIFPGELIANVGETVVSVLDKIKNILGNFEYFYDVYGNFIFQAKHTYENVDFSKIEQNENNEYIINGSFYNNSYIYTFTDEHTLTQISHNPNITNLRNDFSIWGERPGVNNTKVPIHLRYAIQNRPKEYTTYDGVHYVANTGGEVSSIFEEVAKEYESFIQDQKDREQEVVKKEKQTNTLLERYREIIFTQEENEEDIKDAWNDAVFEVDINDNLTEAEKIERKKELENYYTKRLRDSIWILTQLKKAETLSYDENSIYNDYDSALRDIAYRKIPGLADMDIEEGTLTKQVDTIMNSNIYRITQNLKLNPNDDLKKLAMDIRR